MCIPSILTGIALLGSSPFMNCTFTVMFRAEPWRLAKFRLCEYTYKRFLQTEVEREIVNIRFDIFLFYVNHWNTTMSRKENKRYAWWFNPHIEQKSHFICRQNKPNHRWMDQNAFDFVNDFFSISTVGTTNPDIAKTNLCIICTSEITKTNITTEKHSKDCFYFIYSLTLKCTLASPTNQTLSWPFSSY